MNPHPPSQLPADIGLKPNPALRRKRYTEALKEEIDRFRFEEEAIVISEAEEEADKYLCVQTPAPIITYVGDSSNNEEEEMAPKTGSSLRELMKGRNKAPSP